MTLLIQFMREFNERQSQLFLMAGAVLVRYQPPELHRVHDADVAEAAGALAATFETAARGLIYEHRPSSPAAERLMVALKPLFVEASGKAGASFERDAAVVLRRIEEAVRSIGALEPENRRPLLELLTRMIQKRGPSMDAPDDPEASRLIVP